MRTFQRISLATAVLTYALIVVGGVVRVTGSGLGCPDWPLCHGNLVPAARVDAVIEYTHRFVAGIVTLLTVATLAIAWRQWRSQRWIFLPMIAAAGLLVIQIALGAVTVVMELPPAVVTLHLGTALAMLAAVATAATVALWVRHTGQWTRPVVADRLPHLALWSTLGIYVVLLTGALVRGSGASNACISWPLCVGGQVIVPGSFLSEVHMLHRTIVALGGVLLAYTLIQAWRLRPYSPAIRGAALAAAIFFLGQVGVGAANVFLQFPQWLLILHLATASAVWASVVVLTVLTLWVPTPAAVGTKAGQKSAPPRARRVGQVASDYLSLTKPRILVLLVLTALLASFVAARGAPPLLTTFLTLLGGTLAAGGAHAINHYLDRDIDGIMPRTSHRPLPGGRLAPWQALWFGIGLNVLAVVLLVGFVNLLTAALALAASLYYVFVYTWWLKRTSPQNIVIGGAAGAAPPLIGWAGITGTLDLLPIYMFAIIFFWTPPHFWALALLAKKDYGLAGVPMLPVVRGEGETKRQILLYTILLAALSVVLTPLHLMGLFYLVAALALGSIFVALAIRLLRAEATRRAAGRLFGYSMLYLALLFTAMAVDRLVLA